jgi:hypothetical protein
MNLTVPASCYLLVIEDRMDLARGMKQFYL